MVDMVDTYQYKAGDVIIKEKDTGHTAYLIKEGRVSVSKDADGKEIHICDLEDGSIFGEMSMIDEKPRSATVTAVEETVVYEIHRDKFFQSLKSGHDFAFKILRVIFERLRKANATISKLRAEGSTSGKVLTTSFLDHTLGESEFEITLEGLTRKAKKSLPEDPLLIKTFPLRIGRECEDPLVFNDLPIPDEPPHLISRHHIEIDYYDGNLLFMDRGSHLGSIVNGKPVGGPCGDPGPLVFNESEGTLVLGDKDSPYRYKYKVTVPHP